MEVDGGLIGSYTFMYHVHEDALYECVVEFKRVADGDGHGEELVSSIPTGFGYVHEVR